MTASLSLSSKGIFSSLISSIANKAALAFRVSKIVSTNNKSTPPSIKALMMLKKNIIQLKSKSKPLKDHKKYHFLVLRSINRAAKREQTNSKREKKELERREELSMEEDNEVTEREQAIEDKKEEREKIMEERKRVRDSIRAAKKAEYEERRQRLLEERQKTDLAPVKKRIEFISSEKDRLEKKLSESETKSLEIAQKVQQMQGALQQATAAAVQQIQQQHQAA